MHLERAKCSTHLRIGVTTPGGPDLALGQHWQKEDVSVGLLRVQQIIHNQYGLSRLIGIRSVLVASDDAGDKLWALLEKRAL